MIAHAIVIKDHKISELGFETLRASSEKVENDFVINRYDAVTVDTVDALFGQHQIKWNWPDRGVVFDHETGIRKVGYGGRDPKQRYACGMSHYLLWQRCAEENEPFLILEHDALWLKKLDVGLLHDSDFEIIGLNDPSNATRLAGKFDSIVRSSNVEILPVPVIDRAEIAQGLAGNSAYFIKPEGAEKLLQLTKRYGMWPNDAIMCRQLMPDMLGVTKQYYTKVQGLPSTTTNKL